MLSNRISSSRSIDGSLKTKYGKFVDEELEKTYPSGPNKSDDNCKTSWLGLNLLGLKERNIGEKPV